LSPCIGSPSAPIKGHDDVHCHLDLYSQPTRIADRVNRLQVLTVVVTNLPSAFEKAAPHVAHFDHIRLALGLHPLIAEHHLSERKRFLELVERLRTSESLILERKLHIFKLYLSGLFEVLYESDPS
jgi:Tat protein secretion system quality control protein TatD with DNase activity